MSKPLTLTPITIDRLEGSGWQEEPVAPRWKSLKWNKAQASKHRNCKWEKFAFYKIASGGDWWILDDISRGAIGDEAAHGTWVITSQEALERLKLLFRVLGVDDKLTIRENPEWATPLDPKHAQAGVRAGRA